MVASVARRSLVLLSWHLPVRVRAMPAAREGPARRAAAVHVQCPVLGCQVVLARSRRGGLGGDRRGSGGVRHSKRGPSTEEWPLQGASREHRRKGSSPPMEEGGVCDRLKGGGTSEKRVRHCSGAVSAVDEASRSRPLDPLSSSWPRSPPTSIWSC